MVEQIKELQRQLNEAIAAARTSGLTVDIWVSGQGPANTKPSTIELDIKE